jgi:hypothetical protein
MNNNAPPEDENQWETDSENSDGNPIDYFRIKYDNVTKVKADLQKILKLCTRKYKKIDSEAQEKLKIVNKYLNEEVVPTFGIKSEKLYSEDEFDKIFLVGNEYNIIKKPEVGSCLIFELTNKNNSSYNAQPNNLNLVAVTNDYYEATTKIFQRSRLEEANKPKVKKKVGKEKKKPVRKVINKNTVSETNSVIKQLQLKRNLKLRKKLIKTNLEGKIDDQEDNLETLENENILMMMTNPVKLYDNKKKKRRKRKKHKKYIRNSTIITINKIK